MDLNKYPLVSVIITTYNRPDFLKIAIDSVVNQTYDNIEILVIDDGSEVNYAETICTYYKKCKYLHKNNGGISSARNFGVENANGEYIAFLDDDDVFLPFKIEKQLDILLNNKEYYLVHSSALIIDGNGNQTGEIIGALPNKAYKRSGYVFWNALGNWCVKSPTPLIKNEVFKKIQFDEKLAVGEDFDFYQRLFYFYKVYYINEALAFYRVSDNIESLSKNIKKYIGIETRFYENYLRMGVKNPITLYKIALKLTFIGVYKINLYHKENIIEIPKWKIYLNPFYFIKNLNKLEIKSAN